MSTPDDSQAPKREPPQLYLKILGAFYRVERACLARSVPNGNEC